MMPGMSGLEVLERIREIPKTQYTPVVFLTASDDDDESIARAFALGASDYLQKPINRTIFCTRIASLITAQRQSLAASAAASLEGEHERVIEELEHARRLQHAQLPQTPSVKDGWRVVGALRSCNEVGGDLFDIIDTPRGVRTLALVDVSGHGLSAALVGASVRGMLRLLLKNFPIDVVLQELNAQLCAGSGEHYACVALIQLHADTLYIANAGLPPVLVQNAERTYRVAECGVPPGLIDSASYELHALPVHRPTRVIAVTDGITEPFGATDESDVHLDALGLRDIVPFESAEVLSERLARMFAVRNLKPPDDATVLVADLI
jgi:sigma-B regulation protein RsbU (phosphoserine phosphatase)